jgi:hypothetical protein
MLDMTYRHNNYRSTALEDIRRADMVLHPTNPDTGRPVMPGPEQVAYAHALVTLAPAKLAGGR